MIVIKWNESRGMYDANRARIINGVPVVDARWRYAAGPDDSLRDVVKGLKFNGFTDADIRIESVRPGDALI